MKECRICRNKGYLKMLNTRCNQNEIQRCAACRQFDDDVQAQKAYYRQRQRIISCDQWERLYQPMGGSSYQDFHPTHSLSEKYRAIFDTAKSENRVWTEYSSGSHFTIAPGIGWVDRVAFYVTKRPCNINLIVENHQSELCLNISSEDAKALLLKLDRQDFSFKEIWYERQLICDNWIIDDYRDEIVALTRKYQRPLADIIELNW